MQQWELNILCASWDIYFKGCVSWDVYLGICIWGCVFMDVYMGMCIWGCVSGDVYLGGISGCVSRCVYIGVYLGMCIWRYVSGMCLEYVFWGCVSGDVYLGMCIVLLYCIKFVQKRNIDYIMSWQIHRNIVYIIKMTYTKWLNNIWTSKINISNIWNCHLVLVSKDCNPPATEPPGGSMLL